MTRRILQAIQLDKIAAVDRPCQEGAVVTIMKRADPGPPAVSDPPQDDQVAKRLLELRKRMLVTKVVGLKMSLNKARPRGPEAQRPENSFGGPQRGSQSSPFDAEAARTGPCELPGGERKRLLRKEWSEEARAAALEARRRKAGPGQASGKAGKGKDSDGSWLGSIGSSIGHAAAAAAPYVGGALLGAVGGAAGRAVFRAGRTALQAKHAAQAAAAARASSLKTHPPPGWPSYQRHPPGTHPEGTPYPRRGWIEEDLPSVSPYHSRRGWVGKFALVLARSNIDVEERVRKVIGNTAAAYIHDFVHSTNPKFKGKTKQERIRMALGAYYDR
jgi:hypothetical protein